MNEITQRTLLSFQGAGAAWAVPLACVAFVLLGVLGALSVRNVGPGRRTVLVGLRVLLAAALVLLALRPALRRESVTTSATPVAVVVDASGSMGVKDQGGASRTSGVAAWIRRAGQLEELERTAVVDWFAAASGSLRPTSAREVAAASLVAEGGTDLRAVIEAVGERYPGRPRPPVLLFTDGADHGPLRAAFASGGSLAELVPAGGPVHVVSPAPGGLADLSLELVAHDPVGFLRTPITIRARVASVGLPAAGVPVSLLRDGKVVAVRTVELAGDGEADVTFSLEAQAVGESSYALEVPVQAGEALTANNERVFSIRVVRDRLRVLQVVGRPSWDARFLRELLKRDPAIDLISFFILRNAWDDTNADVDELSLIPFPISELFEDKLSSFDLVIFQNFDFGTYGIQPYFPRIRRHVEEGGGLAVVGGDLAFGADYAELSPILPVEVAGASWSPEPVRLALTDVGARHPVFRLGADAGGLPRAVAELAVPGLNVGVRASPEAQVLVRTKDAKQRPVLVVGEAGLGRVATVLTNGTWAWSLPAAGRGATTRTYERTWQNLMRWLVRDPRVALLLLEADRRRVGPGEQAQLVAHVRSESYAPESGVAVAITVKDVLGRVVREESVTTGEDGTVRLGVDLPAAGTYSVVATSPRGGAGPLYVERLDETGELDDVAVDAAFLRALAAATNGTFRWLTEEGGDLGIGGDREVRVEAVEVVPIWRSWWAWGLVAGLACAEWWLRRRWGLA